MLSTVNFQLPTTSHFHVSFRSMPRALLCAAAIFVMSAISAAQAPSGEIAGAYSRVAPFELSGIRRTGAPDALPFSTACFQIRPKASKTIVPLAD